MRGSIRLSAFCRLRRGLSPLPFCYLNAGNRSRSEAFAMPTPVTASHPDDPALLPDRRPDRDHHAQPAGRLQLDRPFDRQEARATRRRGRGVGRYPGAGDPRRRPRVLPPAAICRPSAPRRPPTPSRPWSANCCSTITPSSRPCGGCRRSCCPACTARRPAPACRWPLSPISVSPPKTPASPRPMPSSASRPTAAAPSAWSPASAPAAPCRFFSPKTVFRRRRPMTGVWSPRSFPRPS